MRLPLLAALGLAVIASAQAVTPADAGPFPTRYCAQYKGGAENCGFYSFQQCLASLAGNGGVCSIAPLQTEIVRVHTPRGTRTFIRDAID